MSVTAFTELAKEILAAVTPEGLVAPEPLESKVADLKAQGKLSPYQEKFLLGMIHHEKIRAAAKTMFDSREASQKSKDAAKKLMNTPSATADGPMQLFTAAEIGDLGDEQFKLITLKAIDKLKIPSRPVTQTAPAAKVQDESPAPQNKKNDSTSTSKPK